MTYNFIEFVQNWHLWIVPFLYLKKQKAGTIHNGCYTEPLDPLNMVIWSINKICNDQMIPHGNRFPDGTDIDFHPNEWGELSKLYFQGILQDFYVKKTDVKPIA